MSADMRGLTLKLRPGFSATRVESGNVMLKPQEAQTTGCHITVCMGLG